MEFNEIGFAFVPDRELTKYAQEDKPQWGGHVSKGIPMNYIVLQVHHKSDGHVTNLLFDTNTQTPVEELGRGEPCYCKLDLIRLKFQSENE